MHITLVYALYGAKWNMEYDTLLCTVNLKLNIMSFGSEIGKEIGKQFFNKLLIPFAIVFAIGFALGAWLF